MTTLEDDASSLRMPSGTAVRSLLARASLDIVMSEIDDLAARDPLLAKEIEPLTPEQRQWLEDDLRLRRDAARLSRELLEDESDVYHQLKQLRRSPTERLRLGLSHGRSRPRLVE